jgi:hypothetical protein
LGYDTHIINTHSFRLGAATYYAMLGLNEDEIKKRADGASTKYSTRKAIQIQQTLYH